MCKEVHGGKEAASLKELRRCAEARGGGLNGERASGRLVGPWPDRLVACSALALRSLPALFPTGAAASLPGPLPSREDAARPPARAANGRDVCMRRGACRQRLQHTRCVHGVVARAACPHSRKAHVRQHASSKASNALTHDDDPRARRTRGALACGDNGNQAGGGGEG